MGMHLYFECYYKKYCIFTAFVLLEHTVGGVLLRPRKSRNKGGLVIKTGFILGFIQNVTRSTQPDG